MTHRTRDTAVAGILLLLLACRGDDDGGAADDETGLASGFSGPDSGDDDGVGTADDGADDGWAGTAYEGELLAIMTFVYSAPTALRDEPVVGLVGAYRTAELGFSGITDLYSPLVYQLAFPPLPEAADTLSADGMLPVFEWGDEADWLAAGNAMKLRGTGEGPEALACLVGYFATEATPAGYPFYVSTTTGSEGCAPMGDAFVPASAYDVVLYGGGLFEDNVLPERVTTPPALEITAPDMLAYDAPIDAAANLEIAWVAGDDPEARIEIRLVDADSQLLSVHAADDGSYSIPSADLSALTPGPLDVMVARERTDRVQFTDGGVTVTSRHEHWGFFDLL